MERITGLLKSPSTDENNEFMQFDNTLLRDKNLTFADSNLLEAFKSHLKFEKKSKLERLKSVDIFPDTHVFARFACDAYLSHEVLKNSETLPAGWKLVTTAFNKEISNGYFGAIFIQPEHNRVVIAHRGTEVTNVGSVITDLAGIVFNNCVGQLESACTLAETVTNVMREIENEHKDEIHFELYITGHSLGAFLTQVTAFSNEFLTVSDEEFMRNSDDNRKIYHAQTFAFDSPGAMPMLLKMKKKYETEDHPIDLESLHLLSFLSAPNQINTCNIHYGKVYRTFIDTSKMSMLDRTVIYTLKTHSIDAIVSSFENGDDIEEVAVWPVREGMAGFKELDDFLKIADYRNRYHLSRKLIRNLKSLGIKYRTKVAELAACPLNTFNKIERHFIEFIHWFSRSPDRHQSLHELFNIFNEKKIVPDIEEKLLSFNIKQQNIVFNDVRTKREFIPLVKELLKNYPDIAMKVAELLSDNEIREKVFQLETKYILEKEKKNSIDYKSSIVNISEVLKKQFVEVKVVEGNVRAVLSSVFRNFKNSEFNNQYKDSGVLVMDLKRFLIINEMINLKEFLSKQNEKFLVMILFEDQRKCDTKTLKSIKEFFNNIKNNEDVNVIAIGNPENEELKVFSEEAKNILVENFAEIELNLSWTDITEESQKKILDTKLTFQGRTEKLANLLPTQNVVCDNEILKELLDSDEIKIYNDPLVSSNCGVFTVVYDKREIDMKILMENLEHSKNIFYISGIYSENFDENCEKMKEILKPSKDKENLISRILSVNSDEFGVCTKKLHVYTLPGNENSLADFDVKCRVLSDSDMNVHWMKLKDNKLTLRKSFIAPKFLDRQLMINEAKIDIKNLLLQNDKKVFVIVAPTGDGKSAYLTGLARKFLDSHWIFFLNCTEISFPDYKTEFNLNIFKSFLKNFEDVKLFNFVFKLNLKKNSQRPIVIFLDAFEKVQNEKKRAQIVKMIKYFQQSTTCKVILSANSTCLKPLEELQPAILKFAKLTRSERENIIREEWRSHFNLVWGPLKTAENLDGEKTKFKNYVSTVLDKIDDKIDANSLTTMGAPKQLRLLADGFREDFEKYVNMNRLTKMIFESFAFKLFYKQYVEAKYDLYIKTQATRDEIDLKGKNFLQSILDVPQDVKSLIDSKAEIVSSDYIWLQITKGQNSAQTFNTLVGFILTDPKCAQIRKFLNGKPDYLPKPSTIEISDDILKTILGKPFIVVGREGHQNILSFLIEVLKNKKDLKNVTLSPDEQKKTALDYTVANEKENCLVLLLTFLIEFGDVKDLKEKCTKIGIEKINELLSDENIEKLSTALSKI